MLREALSFMEKMKAALVKATAHVGAEGQATLHMPEALAGAFEDGEVFTHDDAVSGGLSEADVDACYGVTKAVVEAAAPGTVRAALAVSSSSREGPGPQGVWTGCGRLLTSKPAYLDADFSAEMEQQLRHAGVCNRAAMQQAAHRQGPRRGGPGLLGAIAASDVPFDVEALSAQFDGLSATWASPNKVKAGLRVTR